LRLAKYYWNRVKRHGMAIAGLAFIAFLVLMALVSFAVDPTKANSDEKNTPPVGLSSEQTVYSIATGQSTVTKIEGSWSHPLGTDSKGRDMLAMLLSGARIALLMGLFATGIAMFLGVFIGLVAAYFGGWVDNILMRFTDIIMTFPFFLLWVFLVFIFGPSMLIIIMVIGLTGWTGISRLIRSEALSLRTRDFVTASKALGASDLRIIFRHLVPNVISLIIVMTTLSIPGIILGEAALSFIGMGDPTVTSWGIVLQSGQQSLNTASWVAVEPGIMLLLTALAFNFVGDGLRDAFDPKSNA
jgi:peptide/nickel transport system permease protein